MSPPDDHATALTEGERRALGLSARGLGVAEVAEAMGASPEWVRGLLASAISPIGGTSPPRDAAAGAAPRPTTLARPSSSPRSPPAHPG